MIKTVEALRFGEAGEYAIWCERHNAWCVFQGVGEKVHERTVVNLVDSGLQWHQGLRQRGPLRR
jgi:hypothetical protein